MKEHFASGALLAQIKEILKQDLAQAMKLNR